MHSPEYAKALMQITPSAIPVTDVPITFKRARPTLDAPVVEDFVEQKQKAFLKQKQKDKR